MVTLKQGISKTVIIAGFLGSGKTTLLRKCLDWEINRGGRPHVIMSEFGDIDIDGKLIGSDWTRLTTITGGCACCDLRTELAGAFQSALRSAAGETIYIESTGVGDPAGILESIQPAFREGAAALTAVIAVYDAGRPLLTGKDAGLVKRQLQMADTIVVNKADQASKEVVHTALFNISEINPSAELFVTSHGEIDFAKVLTRHSAVAEVINTPATSKNYRSYGFQIKDPMSPAALEKWLQNLPPSVVRAKGFLRLAGQTGIFEVQATRGQISISRFNRGRPPTVLVLISHPMRTDGVVKGLKECLAKQ